MLLAARDVGDRGGPDAARRLSQQPGGEWPAAGASRSGPHQGCCGPPSRTG